MILFYYRVFRYVRPSDVARYFLDIALWVKHPRWLPFHESLNLTDVIFSVITTII